MSDLPLTASDLHAVAEALEPLELLRAITQSPLIGRIEVFRPDGDDVIGYFQLASGFDVEDSWYGFVPVVGGEN